jgi:hypothetical protein
VKHSPPKETGFVESICWATVRRREGIGQHNKKCKI